MSKPKKLTYEVPCADKIVLGRAYYRVMKEKPAELTITSVEVLLYLYTMIPVKSYSFKSSTFNNSPLFCSQVFRVAVKQLADNGYLERITGKTYKLNSKGDSLVHGFWINHGLKVTKLTTSK